MINPDQVMQKQVHVLAVDDQPDNLLILESLLEDFYSVHTVENGQQALDFFTRGNQADLILLDVMMPVLDGFETCRRLKASPQTRDIPILFITGLESAADEEFGLTLGAEDFIHKPFVPAVVMARVRNHLRLAQATQQLKIRNDDLEQQVMERTREIVRQSDELMRQKQSVIAAQDATIMSFRLLAGTRDNETGAHISRTQNYVRVLAEQLRHHSRFKHLLNDETISLLYKSAPLHDIGKVGIPDAVLHKPGKLNAEEWKIMKRHCELGRDAIVSSNELSFLHFAREIAYTHHERWDGSGYPQGLCGEAIPLAGRLMAVADVYDALISKRVYKPSFSHEQSVAMMFAERGKHFDPDILDAMLEISDTFRAIALQFQGDE
jgi:putative two-component system response regulator